MMSNPKIYAHCPAGCKWETVHKSDFDSVNSDVTNLKSDVTNLTTRVSKLDYDYGTDIYNLKNSVLEANTNINNLQNNTVKKNEAVETNTFPIVKTVYDGASPVRFILPSVNNKNWNDSLGISGIIDITYSNSKTKSFHFSTYWTEFNVTTDITGFGGTSHRATIRIPFTPNDDFGAPSTGEVDIIEFTIGMDSDRYIYVSNPRTFEGGAINFITLSKLNVFWK